LVRGQPNDVRLHHGQFLKVLHHRPRLFDLLPTLGTSRQGHLDLFIHDLGNPTVMANMAGFAPRLSRMELALLFRNTKGRCLSGGFLLQSGYLGTQTIVAILQILDLVLEVLDLHPQLLNHPGLTQNNLDQPIGLITQDFQRGL
jgi:hypothetical protein